MVFKRWFGRFSVKQQSAVSEPDKLRAALGRIQAGDEALREKLIQDYRPFILKSTSRFCKRYIDPVRDDEFSIAMIAFNEAIEHFSPASGRSFTGFAETVIRRRLIDYIRREKRHRQTVPSGSFDQEGELEDSLQAAWIQQAVSRFHLDRDAEERRLEIEDFAAELKGYGIRFAELAECSPKHEDSRRLLQGIALRLADQDCLWGMLVDKRRLPVKELMEQSSVSRKTIERNRKYLIAIAVLLRGHYPYLEDYLLLRQGRQPLERNQEQAAGGRKR